MMGLEGYRGLLKRSLCISLNYQPQALNPPIYPMSLLIPQLLMLDSLNTFVNFPNPFIIDLNPSISSIVTQLYSAAGENFDK